MDARSTSGEPRVLISRSALLRNAALLRRRLPPATRICAIVKADAYGHGAAVVVDTLANYALDDAAARPVDGFAVANVDEAAALPATDLPIMIFRPVEDALVGRQRSAIEHAIRANWILTVCSAAAADDVARIAMALQKRAQVQVMIDTGMARSGTPLDQAPAVIEQVLTLPSLRLSALCTHFACSEEAGNPLTVEQLQRFHGASDRFMDPAVLPGRPPLRHAANSGAIFFCPQSHLDMVRPGISLYGIDPTCRPCIDRPLKPVLRWTAPLLMIRDVPAGTSVGYGQTWTAPRATRIGLVPVGYADGYLRSFSNSAAVIVHGRPAPVVGRVSMDLMTIDLTHLPQAMTADEVTLLDDDPLSCASVYALARQAQTIPYEIFCRIGSRIHRVAVDAPESSFSQADAAAG